MSNLTKTTAQPSEKKPGYKKTKMGWIPEEWEAMKIGSFVKTFSGGTPSRSRKEFYTDNSDGLPWIKSGELNQQVIRETEEYVTPEAIANSAAKIVEPGTLLYALYGATAGIVATTSITGA
ncbi:MAG: restriction endonuclease subunit S, partial [Schleiferiaceae bacterium]|nr:restriction endonuclease subunit S [Schleiferiaceae bacterium]